MEKKGFFKQAPVRVGLLLVIILVIFGIARQLSVPETFGQYGRFRGDSIQENVNAQVSFAESGGVCAKCHPNVAAELGSAQHAAIDCQTCHGPGEKHRTGPKDASLKISDVKSLCATCHTTIAGRQGIATVNPDTHSGGVACSKCHNPHQPIGGSRG